jgi:hypothetical protein
MTEDEYRAIKAEFIQILGGVIFLSWFVGFILLGLVVFKWV